MATGSSTSSSGEQQYSLRWNDFHSSILSSFRHLRDEEDFVDVTLACDSGSYTAHKVVLSACSPYFRRLLKANPCQHPIVILRDVASADMESLLRFMYHGEVHVGQEQLAAFLKTAQMLQVRGLADVNNSAASKLPSNTTNNPSNASAPATPRNHSWQESIRGELNDGGVSPPPEKRPRSYSPPLGNHVEAKSDIMQESLLGQALEGGPTIHTPSNNIQAQSTGEDSNSMSDNDEDMSNNDSMLNSVKTEPNDLLNDSLEHHRNSFPAALLGLQGLMPGPSGIHAAANQDPNYGRWQHQAAESWQPSGTSQQQSLATTTAQQQQQQQQQQQSLILAKKKIEELALLQQQQQQHPNFQSLQDMSGQPKPKCPECGKIYSNNSNLKQHIVNVHTVQTQYISCHVCGKQFKTKQYLQIHLLSMHGIRKRKSYPVYQMQTHAQAQQYTGAAWDKQQQQQQ